MKNASVFDFLCFNTITFGRIYPIRTKWVQLGDEWVAKCTLTSQNAHRSTYGARIQGFRVRIAHPTLGRGHSPTPSHCNPATQGFGIDPLSLVTLKTSSRKSKIRLIGFPDPKTENSSLDSLSRLTD